MVARYVRSLGVLLAVIATACQANIDNVPDGSMLSCTASSDCPPGLFCSAAGRCVSGDQVKAPPAALASRPVPQPSLGKQGTTFQLTISSTKLLAQPPDVELELTNLTPFTCTAVTPSQYTCSYAATGDENRTDAGTAGGTIAFDVTLTDLDGNVTRNPAVGSIVLDFTAPTLASKFVTPVAKAGATISIAFTPSEPIATNGGVSVIPSVPLGGQSMLAATNDPGTLNYHVDYPLQPNDANGTVDFKVALTDLAGNPSGMLDIGSTTIDQAVPQLANVHTFDAPEHNATRFSAVSGHNQVTLAFDASKPLGALKVALGALCSEGTTACAFTCGAYQDGSPSYTCAYTVTGHEQTSDGIAIATLAEANLPVSISGIDSAGNAATGGTSVTLDFTPPSFATPPAASLKAVGVGQLESIALSINEPLLESPKLNASGPGSLPFSLVAGSAYTFADTIQSTDQSGHYTTTVSLTDLAGNSTILAGPEFDVDTVVPVLGAVATNATRFSAVAPFSEIQVTFPANKSLDTSPSQLDVHLGALCPTAAGNACSFTCSAFDPAKQQYTCAYQVTGNELTESGQLIASLSEATVPVIIHAIDEASNEDSATASVTLDLQAPTLVSPGATIQTAGVGQTEALVLPVNETLQGTPKVVVTSGSHTLPFQWGTGTAYTFTYAVQSSDASGLYTSLVTMSDLVGNQASVAGPSFTLDTKVPTISNVKTNGTDYSEVAGFNLVTLTFDVAKALSTAPTVTLGGQPMTCNSFQTTSPNYTCTYSVSQTTSSAGAQTILIHTTDEAGNTDTAQATVVFDFTALTLTTSIAPNPAKAGDVPVLSITANKPLVKAPTVSVSPMGTVSGSLGSGGSASGAGTWWTYTFPTAVAPLAGGFSIGTQGVDKVGHQAKQTSTFQVDAAVPTISNVTTNLTRYSAVNDSHNYNRVTLTFDAAKNGVPTALTTLAVAHGGLCLPGPVACTSFTCGAFQSASPNYTCTYTITGHETTSAGVAVGTLPEASLPVTISGTDEVGNQVSASTSITLDFMAPSLVGSPSVSYLPATSNVLTSISGAPVLAARSGTTVRFSFTVSEPLASSGTPTISASPSGLNLVQQSSSGTSYVFDATVGALGNPADGKYSLTISATDQVGNAATLPVGTSAQPIVDNTPPAPPNTGAGGPITYVRVPWGDNTTNGSPSYTITAAAGAISDTSTAAVIAYDSLGAQIGVAPVTGNIFPTMSLLQADRVTVLLAGVDPAGNVSTTVPVHNVTWKASFYGRLPGNSFSNPNSLTTAFDFLLSGTSSPFIGPLQQSTFEAGEAQQADYSAISIANDASSLTTTVDTSVWQTRVSSSTTTPTGRMSHAIAYDSARNRLVVFGGQDVTGAFLSDTWEWDGLEWSNVTPATSPSPSARSGHTMVYDASRGRMVMYGGSGNGPTPPSDVWEWDGSTWMNVTPLTGPTPGVRVGHAMVYDAALGVTLVVAGITTSGGTGQIANDIWSWDGSQWTNLTPSGNALPTRYNHSLVYDGASQDVLLFGGTGTSAACSNNFCNDLWKWNGSGWTLVTPLGGTPSQRLRSGMSYDSARQRVVMFGGSASSGDLNDTWELSWNATSSAYTWSNPVTNGNTTGPAVRTNPVLAYDSVDAVTLLVSGLHGNTSYNDNWSWDGTTWTNQTPSSILPQPRAEHAMTFDSSRARTVLYAGSGPSGYLGDTWEWNGFSWTLLNPATNPGQRFLHAMAFDANSTRNVSVLFGGYFAGLLSDTWTWNGTTWTKLTPATSPAARMGHSMAYDAAQGVTILFGGCGTVNTTYGSCTGILNDTWAWNGTTWTKLSPATSPPARAQAALAYDSARGKVVLFGGCTAFDNSNTCTSELNDTWEWNGTTWTKLTPTTSPSARGSHAMSYDRARGRVVLLGGATSMPLPEVWEWDGTNWYSVTSTVNIPLPRSLHAMVFDSGRNRLVSFGGRTGSSYFTQDTLESPSDPLRRPAQIAKFSFAAAGETSPSIQQMTVDAYASGAGNTTVLGGTGAAVNGATLAVWNGLSGNWLSLASNTSTSPTELKYVTRSPVEAAGYLSGSPETIDLALFPTSGRGNGTGASQVTVDFIGLTVQYQH